MVAHAVHALAFVAAVHGNVTAIDSTHDLLTVHHHAHEGMAMEMTMVVKLKDAKRLATLREGEYVDLRCDQSRNPWVCVLAEDAPTR